VKVLIHKTDHLGDFVTALPVLWELRQWAGPEAEIHILAGQANTEWESLLPWLGKIHPLSHPRYRRGDPKLKFFLTLAALKTALGLRFLGFDWGIDLVSTRNDLLGKWLLLAAGCRKRSGPDGTHSWLLTDRFPEPDSHQTKLLANRFPPEWNLTGQAGPDIWMPESLRWKSGPGPVCLAPFVGTPAKRWPESRWIELAEKIRKLTNIRFLVPKPDVRRNQDFLARLPQEEICEVSSIRETLECLCGARGLICLDTAVAHFAWATGTPQVQIFSGTAHVKRWASPDAIVLQRQPPCYPCASETCLVERHVCMEDIEVEDVLQHTGKLLT